MPLIVILRNRLKYALTKKECELICLRKLVKVDGKIRTSAHFPAGFMDSLQIPKSGDNFRMLYDTKGRFVLNRITEEDAKVRLAQVCLWCSWRCVERRGVAPRRGSRACTRVGRSPCRCLCVASTSSSCAAL